ncbi:MAG: AAA family ATPase, partial [Deltaproteobacteria bacterium]|nr:AAA family ATPase [Deltaproteobacteria bacterium]
MWIRSLHLRDAPGLEPLSHETLQPGVNVIWGPNASGKSTMARALRSLFARGPGGPARVTAIVEEGRGRHELIRPHDGATLWPP